MKKFLAVVIAIAMVFPLMVTDANAAKADVAKDEAKKPAVTQSNDRRETTFTSKYAMKNSEGEVALRTRIEVDVDYYEHGSFRAFYNVHDTRVYIDDCIVDVEVEVFDKTARPRRTCIEPAVTPGFPVNQIEFFYTCVLKTKKPIDKDSDLGKELHKAGFHTNDDYGVAPFTRIIDVYGIFKVM